MDPRETVELYYDAWRARAGDMTGVPLAERFSFRGPVASFDSADGYRAMARQAGAAVRSFRVRQQFADADLVCSIIDWEMAPLTGTLTAAEVLRVRDGVIVSGELIYDAEELRRAMGAAPKDEPPPEILGLLARSYDATAALLATITPLGFAAVSPCAGWTVRQVGTHLIGSLQLLARVAEGETVAQGEFDAHSMAATDHLGPDPVAAFRAVAERSITVFTLPDTLERRYAFPPGSTPGAVLANISMLESVVHGWDLARGAGAPYQVDQTVVEAVGAFASRAIGDEQRRAGLFAAAVPTAADASPLTTLLGHLGRRA